MGPDTRVSKNRREKAATEDADVVSALDKPDVETLTRGLLDAFHGILSWRWDDRFETGLAEFGADDKERVRAILQQYLSVIWDSSNIVTAPAIVRTINIRVASLRSGQLLFTSDPSPGALLFCAWWPWSNEETTSIGIAPFYKKLPDSEYSIKIQWFKRCFGI
jgi:hypothetical protein